MVYCSKCGAQAPDDAGFCPKCGNALKAQGADNTGSDFGPYPDWRMQRRMRRAMRREWHWSPANGLVESILGGALLVWLGILLYLSAAGITAYVTWSNFWAYFLVGIGVYLIARFVIMMILRPELYYSHYGSLIGGVVLIVIGSAWLTWTMFGWNYALWPLIIVLLGLIVVVGGIARFFSQMRRDGPK